MSSNLPTLDALYDSAKKYALSALKVFGTLERDRFPIYAGTALEHLTKACLFNAHPALLIELKNESANEDSLFILTGLAASSQSQLRTVSMINALRRATRLFQSQTPPLISRAIHGDLLKLVELRNGQAHIANGESENIEILTAFLLQMEISLRYLAKDRIEFWDLMVDVVDSAISENIDKVARDVALKMTQSRMMIQERIIGMDQELIDILRDARSLPTFDEEIRRCPVCRSFGVATGNHRLEYDVDEDFQVSGEWVEFLPLKFRCPTCSLSLNSLPELLEAGFDEVSTSDMKPEEFLSASYNEEDWDTS